MAEPKFDIENSPVPQIFELYEQNLNLRQIADQLGLHNTVVGFVIKHSNIKSRKPLPRGGSQFNGGKHDQTIIELAPTHNKDEIAKIIDMKPHSIYLASRRLGVSLKPMPRKGRVKGTKNKPEPKRTITAKNKKFTLEQEQKIRELAPTHNKYELAKIVGLEPTQVYNLSLRLGVSIKHAKNGAPKGVTKRRRFQTSPKKPKTPKTPPIHTIPSAPCEEQEYNHLIVHYKGTAKKQSINIPMESATADKDVILDIVNKNRPRWTTSAYIDCYKRDGIKYSTPHRKSAIKEDGKLVYGVEHNKKETS